MCKTTWDRAIGKGGSYEEVGGTCFAITKRKGKKEREEKEEGKEEREEEKEGDTTAHVCHLDLALKPLAYKPYSDLKMNIYFKELSELCWGNKSQVITLTPQFLVVKETPYQIFNQREVRSL